MKFIKRNCSLLLSAYSFWPSMLGFSWNDQLYRVCLALTTLPDIFTCDSERPIGKMVLRHVKICTLIKFTALFPSFRFVSPQCCQGWQSLAHLAYPAGERRHSSICQHCSGGLSWQASSNMKLGAGFTALSIWLISLVFPRLYADGAWSNTDLVASGRILRYHRFSFWLLHHSLSKVWPSPSKNHGGQWPKSTIPWSWKYNSVKVRLLVWSVCLWSRFFKKDLKKHTPFLFLRSRQYRLLLLPSRTCITLKKLMTRSKKETKVTIDWAYGHKDSDQGQEKQIWIAGGIGITPLSPIYPWKPHLNRSVSFHYMFIHTGAENAVYLFDSLKDYAA